MVNGMVVYNRFGRDGAAAPRALIAGKRCDKPTDDVAPVMDFFSGSDELPSPGVHKFKLLFDGLQSVRCHRNIRFREWSQSLGDILLARQRDQHGRHERLVFGMVVHDRHQRFHPATTRPVFSSGRCIRTGDGGAPDVESFHRRGKLQGTGVDERGVFLHCPGSERRDRHIRVSQRSRRVENIPLAGERHKFRRNERLVGGVGLFNRDTIGSSAGTGSGLSGGGFDRNTDTIDVPVGPRRSCLHLRSSDSHELQFQ